MKQRKLLPMVLLLFFLILSFPSLTANAADPQTNKAGLEQPTLVNEGALDTSDLFTEKRSSYYNSKWETYSSYYYYNQMNATQKAFYDRLNAMCISYLEGTSDARYSIYRNTRVYMTSYCSASKLSENDAYQVALMFYYSNPQYYFLRPSFYISYSASTPYISIGVYEGFADGSKRKTATSNFKKKIDADVALINKEGSVTAKEKKAHDLITSHVVYQSNTYDQSAYSTFLEGQTVCAGYSAAFSILCNAVGIDTAVVTSYDHAWNYIRLNNSWYYVDCTWDDTDGQQGYERIYIFFNRSQDKFLNVSGNDFSHHIEEDLWNGYMPVCTLDSGATLDKIGNIYTPKAKTSTPSITIAKKNGYNTVTLKSATKNATIYYTTDGSNPSAANSKSYKYHSSFSVTRSSTIKAVAVSNSNYDSSISSASQTVTLYSAAAPKLSSQPASKTYAYKTAAKALTVKASATDGGTLSYQWYQNKTASTKNGTAIKNATSKSYTPSTSSLGTTYYYCVVTNTNTKATTTKKVSKTTSVAKIVTAKREVKNLSISKLTNQTFTGKSLKPALTLKWGKEKLKKGKDYTISYKNNKAIGKASITITGTGYYTGTKTVTFKIIPASIKVRGVSAKSKAFTMNWKKDTAVNGYQIQYGTKKSFSGAKTATIKKGSCKSATISKLKAKKGYYVRIRSYKTVNGKNYYSNWSKSYSIKTK